MASNNPTIVMRDYRWPFWLVIDSLVISFSPCHPCFATTVYTVNALITEEGTAEGHLPFRKVSMSYLMRTTSGATNHMRTFFLDASKYARLWTVRPLAKSPTMAMFNSSTRPISR